MPEEKKLNTRSFTERLVPSLVIVSVLLAFAVGVLWQKVESLTSGTTQTQGSKVTNTPSAPDAAAPTNGKLSEDQAKKVSKVTAEDWVKGERDAKVFLIEYSDLECPFCKRYHPTALQALDEYQGDLALVYRHFPLDTLHPKADKEAEAAECAGELGGNDGFWAYVDKIFEVTPSNNGLDAAELPKIAGQVGLNQSTFLSCLDSGKYKDKVEAQYQTGITAGVTGTPASFVMNSKGEVWTVPGAVPYENLKATLDEALKS